MTEESKARNRDLPPHIHVLGLPENERRAASQIQMQLHDLAAKGRDFEAAVALFQHSMLAPALKRAGVPINPDTTPWARYWPYIAARDGAMTIYHFGMAIQLISRNFATCPTLLSLVDRKYLRMARRRMNEVFPRFEIIRHAVAHSTEIMNQQSIHGTHSISGPYEIAPGINVGPDISLMLGGTLKNQEFLWTVDGKLQSYEISKATLDGMTDVRIDIYAAFSPAESKTLAMARGQEHSSNRTEPT